MVHPNFDTLYPILWFDRDEPIVISVPDTGGRSDMLPSTDMRSDARAVDSPTHV